MGTLPLGILQKIKLDVKRLNQRVDIFSKKEYNNFRK